ncbi:MAG TPA: anthranilate phosphoribosyltransferase [Verrucomicrobiae bacterium]|nr:anthranilate phosphoribosyltransferase [Verrucomicrobiae bacterium]
MSEPLEQLIQRLNAAQTLEELQVWQAVEQLASENVAPELKAEFLTALSRKGETPGEIAAFARALRDKSLPPPIDKNWRASREILDIVGTGGDRLGTFNISTTSAIVCAAAGVPVAKHGNRAVTSQAGSADVLEALGVPVDLTPEAAARSLREHGFAFFFAQKYHPAFKNIAPARKLCAERGVRTIFNLLGPLLNPARPSAMLAGVPRPDFCEPLAQVLKSLGVRRAIVVCGGMKSNPETPNSRPQFLDELSTLGENTIAEFYHERGFSTSILPPENLPLQPAGLADLLGGDRYANAEITRRILSGHERGPKRDAVLLNAGAGLFVAGRTKSLAEGWELATVTIDSGQAGQKLAELAR